MGVVQRAGGRYAAVAKKKVVGTYDSPELAAMAFDVASILGPGGGEGKRAPRRVNYAGSAALVREMVAGGEDPMKDMEVTFGRLCRADEGGAREGGCPGRWLPFSEARVRVRGEGLKSQRAFLNWLHERRRIEAARARDIPTQPHKTYAAAGWVSWHDFLGLKPPSAHGKASPEVARATAEGAGRAPRAGSVARRAAAPQAVASLGIGRGVRERATGRALASRAPPEARVVMERTVRPGWGWRLLEARKPTLGHEEVRDPKRTIPCIGGLSGRRGEMASTAEEFILQGCASAERMLRGGEVAGECAVGATVGKVRLDVKVADFGQDALERATSERQRIDTLEREGKALGYDQKLWKQVMEYISSCATCGIRPLVAEGVVRGDAHALWMTLVCSECRTQCDGTAWHRLNTKPSKEHMSEMRHSLLAERLRRGKSLNTAGSHRNEHLWCAHHKEEANAARDEEDQAMLERALNVSLKELVPKRQDLFVPRAFVLTQDEVRVLRGSNISVPDAGGVFCREDEGRFDAHCQRMLMGMALLDGYERIRDIRANRTFFFKEAPLLFLTERELMERYRDIGEEGEDTTPIENDCPIPYIAPFWQPNLNPEIYQQKNEYLADLVRRHAQALTTKDEQDDADRIIREDLYLRVALHAYDPRLGQDCDHMKSLSSQITEKWSPTGLKLVPKDAPEKPFRPSYMPRTSESEPSSTEQGSE